MSIVAGKVRIKFPLWDQDGLPAPGKAAAVSAVLLISKNDGAPAGAAGTLSEIGSTGYYVYESTLPEAAGAITLAVFWSGVADVRDAFAEADGPAANVAAAVAAIAADVVDIAGLLHRNALLDNTTYVDGFLVSGRLRVFTDAAALAAATAGAADGTNGEIRRFVLTGTDEGGGKVGTFKIARML